MISKIKTLLKYAHYFLSKSALNYTMLDDEAALSYMEEKDLGIIRWGDGETNIAYGFSIMTNGQVYQKRDPNLCCILNEIVETYSPDARYLLALPNQFLSKDAKDLTKAERILWANTRFYFQKRIKPGVCYADAFLFRNIIIQGKDREQLMARLVRRKQNVILVSGNAIYDEQITMALSEKKVYEIRIPERNAFSDCDEIMERINKIIADGQLYPEDTCLLIGGGPAGKVLAYRYAQKGFSCFDLGFFLNPAPIEKKYNLRKEQ